MNTNDLLKEAIADAKTVRETALAQAKLALEEAFTPRLQSMFTAKLQEKMDDMEENETIGMAAQHDGRTDTGVDEMAKKTHDMESYDDDDNRLEEIDLEEILAELSAELEESENLNENEEEDAIDAEEDVDDLEDDAKEDASEEKEVSELSMDELESMIRDIVSQEMKPDGEDEDILNKFSTDVSAEETTDDLPDTTDDEVNIDEILAELLDDAVELHEGKKRSKYGGNKGDVPASKRGDKKDTAEEEGVEDYKKKQKKENLKEDVNAIDITAVSTVVGVATAILAPLFNALSKAETLEEKQAVRNQLGNAIKGAKGIREAELQNDLTTLREELQEVNLLNAKLLYVNKIFKAKNLSEAQKLKVVKAFDKAESAKEAKLVYESLSEAFSARTDKNQIKESLGFASKAAGIAPQKQQIVEGNDFIARMQKLANIK